MTGPKLARRRLLSLPVAGLCACGGPRLDDAQRLARPPTVRLVAFTLEAEAGDDDEALATTVLAIENPNDWGVTIDVVTLNLVLNGTYLGRTAGGRDLFIGGGRSRTLALALPFWPTSATAALLTREAPPRGVGFSLTGTMKLVGRGVDLLPFALEGRWPLA